MSLQGRTAIVTGAGSGIGRGVSLALCRRGARVVLCGRRLEALEETAREVHSLGGEAQTISCDVGEFDSVRDAFKEAAQQHSNQIDILVNNAGLGGSNPIDSPTDEHWQAVIRTNLHGPFNCIRAVLPWIKDAGRIINMSSILGRFGVPRYTAYCASKHGVIGLTRALALELAPRKITVNAICPGWVETEMARLGMEIGARDIGTTYEEYRKRALKAVPLKEIVEPSEIGEMVCYLCSEEARNITGQAYNICGGQVMN